MALVLAIVRMGLKSPRLSSACLCFALIYPLGDDKVDGEGTARKDQFKAKIDTGAEL